MQWVSTDKGRHLVGRPSTNTAPELLLRKALHAAGVRFRLQRAIARGCTADIVLPGRRLAVFVDGDFWHGCPAHFPNAAGQSGPNAELWSEKRRKVAERDAHANSLAREQGWTVVRIWECQIREDPSAAARRVLAQAAPPTRR